MHTPVLFDHALVVALIAVRPIHGALEYRRMVRRIQAGVPEARAHDYRSTMIRQWILTAGVLVLWGSMERPAELLGFALPGGIRLVIGATLTVLGLAFLHTQWRSAMTLDESGLEDIRAQMGSVIDFLPRTAQEAALFRGLSITAGICEEIICRGYLIWYLAAFVGEWPGAVLAGATFGAFHIYQGISGAVRTGVIGLFAGLLYVGTDSLLWPMILHIAIDLQGGAIARRALVGAGRG